MQRDSLVTIDPPAVTVTDITEPTAASEGLELIDQDVVQLQPMPLRARRVMVRLPDVTVVFHSTNRQVRTRTRVHDGLIAYVVFGPQTAGTIDGVPVRPGLMLAAQPETEARFVSEPGWETIAILVSPANVQAHLTTRGRAHEFHVPRGIEALQTAAEGPDQLFAWGKRLTMTAARQPEIFNEGETERRAAQVELFETLLQVLGASHQLAPTRNDRTRHGHSDIVAAAEAHALARIDEHPSVTDLCRAAGVSERTLEYAFREVMGVTPMAYLTRLRLHRVRQGLLAGTHATTTVTAEALNWGFWHFGEFSRAYKACFGELPSETLRRASHRSS